MHVKEIRERGLVGGGGGTDGGGGDGVDGRGGALPTIS